MNATNQTPKIPRGWRTNFVANLDEAIKFHRLNKNDPYNIEYAVMCALIEVRNAIPPYIRRVKGRK